MSSPNPDRFKDALENIDTSHPKEYKAYKQGKLSLGKLHDELIKFVESKDF
jgi:hypothetical protein